MSRNFELLKRAEFERQGRSPSYAVEELQPHRPLPPLPSETRRRLAKAPADAVRPEMPQDLAPEINKLVQTLFLTNSVASPRVVLFSSVVRKTTPDFVAAQVAESLADHQLGSIALIDADIERPSLHAYFNVSNSMGIMTAVSEQGPLQAHAHSVVGCDVTVVTSGRATDGSVRLLAGEAMTERLREMRANFDYVVITAPPITECPTIATLGQRADGVVLIVEANDTRREVAFRVKQQWERANVTLLGAVLNNRTFPIPAGLYARL